MILSGTAIASFPDRWDNDRSTTFLSQFECALQDNEPKTNNEICKSLIDTCIDFIDVEYCVKVGSHSEPYSCRSAFTSTIADLVSVSRHCTSNTAVLTDDYWQAEKIHEQYGQFQKRLQSRRPNESLFSDLYVEMQHLERIDDVLDELTMIKRALSNQAYHANRALQEVSSMKRQKAASLASYHSHPHFEVFERLTDDARRVRKCVRNSTE